MMKKLPSKIYLGIIFLFLYAPIFVLIVFSFNSSKSRSVFSEFTFKWYEELFRDSEIMGALANTLIIAVIASVLATILGTFAAVAIRNFGKKSRSVVMNVTYLPIINPEIVTGVSLMMLFVIIGGFIGFEMGFFTVLVAHITFNVPYIILNVLPKLRQMDQSIYEAALDLGCHPRRAFFKVVIPQIMPGIISGFLMALTFSIDDFIVTYFTSGSSFQTLPVLIYSMTRKRVSPKINALSAVMFVFVLAVLIITNVLDAKREKEKNKNFTVGETE